MTCKNNWSEWNLETWSESYELVNVKTLLRRLNCLNSKKIMFFKIIHHTIKNPIQKDHSPLKGVQQISVDFRIESGWLSILSIDCLKFLWSSKNYFFKKGVRFFDNDFYSIFLIRSLFSMCSVLIFFLPLLVFHLQWYTTKILNW